MTTITAIVVSMVIYISYSHCFSDIRFMLHVIIKFKSVIIIDYSMFMYDVRIFFLIV